MSLTKWRVQGFCALSAFLATAPLAAQRLPRYAAAQFACAAFELSVHTTVTTELEGKRREERVRREGRLMLTGTPAVDGIAIEAWWDSLDIERHAEGGDLHPDTDGLLGGRYRGILTPEGRFIRAAAPWIPDEVGEVSDLSVALDDLFPVFAGSGVRRLADSAGLSRYRLMTDSTVNAPRTGERPFDVHESDVSDGIAVWGPAGLVRWARRVTADSRVAESTQRTFHSVAVQEIALSRAGDCAGR